MDFDQFNKRLLDGDLCPDDVLAHVSKLKEFQTDTAKMLQAELDMNKGLKARVKNLEAKLQRVIDAWYFPPKDVADPTVGLVMCMCGNRLKFRDSASRVDRAVDCSGCKRRWIWRWTEGKDQS